MQDKNEDEKYISFVCKLKENNRDLAEVTEEVKRKIRKIIEGLDSELRDICIKDPLRYDIYEWPILQERNNFARYIGEPKKGWVDFNPHHRPLPR